MRHDTAAQRDATAADRDATAAERDEIAADFVLKSRATRLLICRLFS